ncbi:MAG: hypothetical protein R2883_05270 [Caldisericia bacterium]
MIVNLIRWILRIIASVLFVFFVIFMISHLFIPDPSTEGYVFTVRDIIMFVGMFSMIFGFGMIWLNELVSGLMVFFGYLVFSITNYVTTSRFYTGEVTLVFLVVGLLILLLWSLERNIKKEK